MVIIAELPLLSVCIPTYNRLPCLRRCLESVIGAVQHVRDPIEILISDNASSDGTALFLADLQSHNPLIRVVRQPSNIGGERNFRVLMEAAQGRFVWIFGDDDVVELDGIALVIARLKDGASSVVCNYTVWNKDLKTLIAARGLKARGDRIIRSKNEVMRRFGLNLGYISSVIMQRDLFLTINDDQYEELTSYGFPFLYAAFAGLSRDCTLHYIDTPILKNRTGNSGDYDWYRYFVTGSCLIFDRLSRHFGYGMLSIVIAKNRSVAQFVLRHFIGCRLAGESVAGLARLFVTNYWMTPLFWLAVVPAMCLPLPLIQGAIGFFKSMRRRGSATATGRRS